METTITITTTTTTAAAISDESPATASEKKVTRKSPPPCWTQEETTTAVSDEAPATASEKKVTQKFPPPCWTQEETTTAASVSDEAPATASAKKVTRKFPPPCWTQEETLALIEAYRDRWYALRRGYLRTPDWDSVAASVTERCPGASPSKTSAQGRHKMEKLRQRYRAEKQRSLAYPEGCFFSSWFFFENMDAMEHGAPLPGGGSNREVKKVENLGEGEGLKNFLDCNILKLKLSGKVVEKVDEVLEPRFDFYPGRSYGGKVGNDGYNRCMGGGCDKEEEDEDEYRVGNPVVDVQSKKFRSMFVVNKSRGINVDHGNSNGFNVRDPVSEDMLPPGVRAKRYGRVDQRVCPGFDGEGGESNGNRNVAPQGSRGRYGGNVDGNLDPRGLNGYSSRLSSSGDEKGKRGRDPMEEMAMSIKMLGEGFVQMEKMKMDMARDMEKMRMEMEITRNEMILNSQKQIMDAFVKGLLDIKTKKAKTAIDSPE